MIKFDRSEQRATMNAAQASAGNKVATNSLGATSKKIVTEEDSPYTKDVAFKSESNSNYGGAQSSHMSSMPIEVDIDPLLKDIVFSEDLEQKRIVTRLYRDIYYNDAVGGSAVDLVTTMVFSDITLGGITDPTAERHFMETIERLNCRTLLPHAAVDHLVDGTFLGSLLYNKSAKKLFDIMPHRIDNAKIDRLPFFGQDPIITVAIEKQMQQLMLSGKDRIKSLTAKLGPEIVNLLSQDAIELDPMSTVYIPRKAFSTGEGVSWFRRILPLYLIEKNLFRGTLVESARRQRGILHLSLGDGDQWEPTIADMNFVTELFMNADSDPLGAVIATRLGITAEELRQGGDFWKVTDIWDSTATFKMRSLGLSESLLSGEQNLACLAGDSLIPTEHGLIRIDQLVDKQHLPVDTSEAKKDIYIPLNVKVQSRYAVEPTAKWKYSGYADTIRVRTHLGNQLDSTGNHPYLVFENGETKWRRTDKLKEGDFVCIATKGLTRSSSLPLSLSVQEGNLRKELRRPTAMNSRLAYLLGAFVAEGNIVEGKKLCFSNGDQDYLARVVKFMRKEFGIEGSVKKIVSAGDAYNICGKEGFANRDCFLLSYHSITLVEWFKELGFVYVQGKASSPSSFQEVPWSVLQADGESQLAFLSGYIEGDGYMNDRISCHSRSRTLLLQLQAMLLTHGIISRVTKGAMSLGYTDSKLLWTKISKFMCTKQLLEYSNRGIKPRIDFGFPVHFLKEFLSTRKIKAGNKAGTVYRTDSNQEVALKDCAYIMKNVSGSNFMYDKYDSGDYADFLETLKVISLSMYNRVMALIELRYMVVPITKIRQGKKQHVYDISMAPGVEPAFVANGMIVHNTADANMTVFIEWLRSFRDYWTQKFFYNKIFPLVSLTHGYTVNSKGKMIRKDGLLSGNVEANLDKLADGTRLLIPTVHYSRQLKPEGDSAYMEMLNSLTEKGVPVPLRALAAAGGFNIDALLADSSDNLKLQKRLFEYAKELSEMKKKYGPADEGGEALASASSLHLANMLNGGRSNVLNDGIGRHVGLDRDFGDASEITTQTRTGKKKMVYNQALANEKSNRSIAKALKHISENKKTPLSHSTHTKR